MAHIIKVKTPLHSYEVKIIPDCLNQLASYVTTIWSQRKVAIITDENVGPLYAKQIQAQLDRVGFDSYILTIPAGEKSKSWSELERIINQLASWKFTRSDGVIALGGGVTGDLAGLVASIYMRGISLIQIPTSLLAQVDSSVGGKTAIDLTAGKNLIGTFYQPDLVLIDPTVLKTLSARLIAEGYGEVIKCAALAGGEFWNLTAKITSCNDIIRFAEPLIANSISFKATVVSKDETETAQRQLLNLGHTLGHAVELAATGRLFHGEAVSIGLYQICSLFEKKQLTTQGLTALLAKRLSVVNLPLTDVNLNTPAFFSALQHDKKIRDGQLTLVYLKEIGCPAFYQCSLKTFIPYLQQQLVKQQHTS